MSIFANILRMLKEESFPGCLEKKYREADYLKDLDTKGLLFLVLAIGHDSSNPPSWAILECIKIVNHYRSFVDLETFKPLGNYTGDSGIMCQVALNYIEMQRDSQFRGKRILRSSILKALGGKETARSFEIRRIYRIWGEHTKMDKGGRNPRNRWIDIARMFLDVRRAVKEISLDDRCAGCGVRIVEDALPEFTLTVRELGEYEEDSTRNLSLCSPECAVKAVELDAESTSRPPRF